MTLSDAQLSWIQQAAPTFGLSSGLSRMLGAVLAEPGAFSFPEVAKASGLRIQSVSRGLRTLQRRGLLELERLTPQGDNRRWRAKPGAALAAVLPNVSQEERRVS